MHYVTHSCEYHYNDKAALNMLVFLGDLIQAENPCSLLNLFLLLLHSLGFSLRGRRGFWRGGGSDQWQDSRKWEQQGLWRGREKQDFHKMIHLERWSNLRILYTARVGLKLCIFSLSKFYIQALNG